MNSEDLLIIDSLRSSSDAASAVKAIERLLQSKRVSVIREEPLFGEAIQSLLSLAEALEGQGRLLVVAALYRLGASSKPVAKRIETGSESLFFKPLPPIELLESGEDRYYIATAVRANWREWSSQYAAHAIATEESAETTRKAFADALAARTDVSSLIRDVASQLKSVNYSTENPAESSARRIVRVITSIRPALLSNRMEPGANVGRALEDLFLAAQMVAVPEEGVPGGERAASECCGLVNDILRSQIEIVSDASVYRSLQHAAQWTSVKLWPHFVRQDENAADVLKSLERAVVLLARRGTTDAELLGLLQFFLGTREEAAKRAAGLAEGRPDLTPEIREWLSLFGKVRSPAKLSSMSDANEVGSDPAIANALVSAWSVKNQLPELLGSSLPKGVQRLLSDVEQLASERRLALKLQPGDVVEYSHLSHELVGGDAMGVRHVVVVVPMVEKTSPNGIPSVVRKAIVERKGG